MASTAKDFINNALDRLSEGADKAADWMKSKAQGLRGDAAAPEAAPTPVERPLSGAARSAVDGQEVSRNMSGRVFSDMETNARLQSEYGPTNGEGLRSAARAPYDPNALPTQGRPNLSAGQTSPEGYDFARSRGWVGGQPPAPPSAPAAAAAAPQAPTPRTGFLRGAVRAVAPVATALAAGDAALKASEGHTPEQLTGTGGALQGGATELYDSLTFGQGRRFAHGVKRALGTFPALRTPEDGQHPAGLRGIVSRFGQGWDEGAALEARAAQAAPSAPAGARAVAQAPGAPATADYAGGPPSFNDSNWVQLGNGDRARPGVMTDPNSPLQLVPAMGTGAFQRTTKGNPGVSQPVGAPGDYRAENPVYAGYGAGYGSAGGLRRPAVPQGVFGEIAAQQGLRTADVGAERRRSQGNFDTTQATTRRAQDVLMRGQDLTATTARAQLLHELGKENRKNVESQIESHADRMVPVAAQGSVLDRNAIANRDTAKKQYASDLRGRIEFSLADSKDGRTPENLSPAEFNQLLVADKVRRKVEDKRSELGQSVRDFFGNKRFNGDNLYGYMPASVKPALDGGYLVEFGNGNTAKADIVGGEFKWLTPNSPVDADIQAMVAPLIKKAKAQQGSK